MAKKVTYKLINNTKLKETSFNGITMHPLYLQVSYDGKATYIKSYYFDLFQKERFIKVITLNLLFTPKMEEVILAEEKVIEFLLKEHSDDFDLAKIKHWYKYWTGDMTDIFLKSFQKDLLFVFSDYNMPELGKILAISLENLSFKTIRENLIDFSKEGYKKIFDNYFIQDNPFFTLNEFMNDELNCTYLSRFMWKNIDIQNRFNDFVTKKYPNCDLNSIYKKINDKLILDRPFKD